MKFNVTKIDPYTYTVDLRSYNALKCIKSRRAAIIVHEDEQMTIPYDQLDSPRRVRVQPVKSKFEGEPDYELWSYKWAPDEN